MKFTEYIEEPRAVSVILDPSTAKTIGEACIHKAVRNSNCQTVLPISLEDIEEFKKLKAQIDQMQTENASISRSLHDACKKMEQEATTNKNTIADLKDRNSKLEEQLKSAALKLQQHSNYVTAQTDLMRRESYGGIITTLEVPIVRQDSPSDASQEPNVSKTQVRPRKLKKPMEQETSDEEANNLKRKREEDDDNDDEPLGKRARQQ